MKAKLLKIALATVGLAAIGEIMYHRISRPAKPSAARTGIQVPRMDIALDLPPSEVSAPADGHDKISWHALYRALAAVEGWRPDDRDTAQWARGPLQITAICLDDCNRISGGRQWTSADRRDPRKAMAMMRLYLRHYGRHDRRPPDVVRLARIWRNGPTGWRESWTEDYGERVSNLYREYADDE